VGSEPKSGLRAKAKNAESSKGKRAEDAELSVVRASAWRNQAGIRPSARCESAHGCVRSMMNEGKALDGSHAAMDHAGARAGEGYSRTWGQGPV
jgi:hypothetical protein